MEIQTMKIFQTVAREGSFSAAASVLNYAQSNISTKIQQLETDTQTTLFYRHNRGVTLTPKGTLLLKYVDKIISLLDETSSVMLEDGTARGPLAIGSMETVASVYLPKILSTYHKKHPEVSLSLQTGTSTANLELLLSHSLDLAFIAAPINHPDIDQVPFRNERLALVSGIMQNDISSWKEIHAHTLLVFPYGCTYRQVLEQLLYQEGITPESIIEFNSLGAIIGSICAGLGIGLLPLSTVNSYLTDGLMKSYPIPEEFSSLSTVIAYRKDHFQNAAFTAFINSVKE